MLCLKKKRVASHSFEGNYFLLLFFQVSEIQGNSSRLEVENRHLISNFQECQRTRSEIADQTAKQLDLMQKTHDDKVNHHWMDDHSVWEAGANKELCKKLIFPTI